MGKLLKRFQEYLKAPEPRKPGIYHYISPPDNPLNYRLHLRLEPDGKGVLMVNASTVLHLNPTAAEHAYLLVHNTPPKEAAREISNRYKIGQKDALNDFYALKDQVETFITTEDLEPVTFLDFDDHSPYTQKLTAPYRLDCALTYRLPEGASTDAAPTKRADRELSTEEWKQIFDKAWEAGIPHIVFTGGEPTLRDDLNELILHAENNGQITGLITDGLKLGDTKYLNKLLQSGLDHTLIILQPKQQESWDSLGSFAYWTDTLNEDIFVAAHLTLTKENAKDSIQLLDKLSEAGISAISLSVNHKSLNNDLQLAREHVENLGIDLLWDMPVPYSDLNPVALELEMDQDEDYPSGAGKGWLYVEPDGDVLPAQGINNILGNLSEALDNISQPLKNPLLSEGSSARLNMDP